MNARILIIILLLTLITLLCLKKLRQILNCHKFKIGKSVRITKYNNIFSKGYTENWLKELFVIDSVLKTNHIKLKI